MKTDTGQEDTQTEEIIQQEIQSSSNDQELGPPRPSMNVPLGRNEVLIRGDEQEKNQDIYTATGHVVMRFRTYTLHADKVTYDSTTGQIKANGHVVFDGGAHNEHLVGTHATYDVSRDSGTFYDVVGSTGVKVKNKDMFLTSSTPFFFTGKVVDKLDPDHYRGPLTAILLRASYRSPSGSSTPRRPSWKWAPKPPCITPPCASDGIPGLLFSLGGTPGR